MSATRYRSTCTYIDWNVHDLHLDYSRSAARENRSYAAWHRRLLNGHLSEDICTANNDEGSLSMKMLDYTPRPWWENGIPNSLYIRRNLSRHLSCSCLQLELGSVVLDIHWINAQACTGGILGVMNDYSVLESVLSESGVNDSTRRSIRSVRRVLERSSANMGRGLQVLSFMLLSRLYALSETDLFLERFLERVKAMTPKPCLVPTMCSYRAPRYNLNATIDLSQTSEARAGLCSAWLHV